MGNLKFFLIIFTVGMIIGLCTNSAVVLVCGIIFAIVLECISEVNRMKTKSGRNQIAKEIQRERDIEEYWGVIDCHKKDK